MLGLMNISNTIYYLCNMYIILSHVKTIVLEVIKIPSLEIIVNKISVLVIIF